jgi:hypothetical protein
MIFKKELIVGVVFLLLFSGCALTGSQKEDRTVLEKTLSVMTVQGTYGDNPVDLTFNLESNTDTKEKRQMNHDFSAGFDFNDPIVYLIMSLLFGGGIGIENVRQRKKKKKENGGTDYNTG